jgi:predicted glycoside hydrolase/deacetylase ChbG (UPF0249 family)
VLEALLTLSWETGLPVRSPSPEVRERLRQEGLPTSDAFVDAFHGEGATLENLVRLLGKIEDGTTELMCHPAQIDEELRSASSYVDARAAELAALTHLDARATLQACGVQLVNYGVYVP